MIDVTEYLSQEARAAQIGFPLNYRAFRLRSEKLPLNSLNSLNSLNAVRCLGRIWKLRHGHGAVEPGCWIARSHG